MKQGTAQRLFLLLKSLDLPIEATGKRKGKVSKGKSLMTGVLHTRKTGRLGIRWVALGK